MNNLQQAFEGKIDFEGQRLVDDVVRVVLISSTVLSFVLGFALQSLLVTFAVFGGLTLLLTLAVIPPWHMFNTHPVQWLSVKEKKKKQ